MFDARGKLHRLALSGFSACPSLGGGLLFRPAGGTLSLVATGCGAVAAWVDILCECTWSHNTPRIVSIPTASVYDSCESVSSTQGKQGQIR